MEIVQIGGRFDGLKSIPYISNYYIPDCDLMIVSISGITAEIRAYLSSNMSLQYADNLKNNLLSKKEMFDEFYLHKGAVIAIIDAPPQLSFLYGHENIEFDILNLLGLTLDYNFVGQTGTNIGLSSKINWPHTVRLSFQGYFDNVVDNVIAFVKKSNKTLGFHKKISNGSFFIIPNIILSSIEESQILQSALADLAVDLNKAHESDLPIEPLWLNDILIGNEQQEKLSLIMLNEKQDILDIQIQKQKLIVNNYSKVKSILYTDGAHLENIVGLMFKEFGFDVQTPPGNREDLFLKLDNFEGVVEVKGQKGSATTQNAAQVDKWSTNYIIAGLKPPKPILIVNTFKDKPLTERIEISFPENMLDYSIPRNHCLILTKTLLDIYIDFKEKLIQSDLIKDLFNQTTGELIYKPKFSNPSLGSRIT